MDDLPCLTNIIHSLVAPKLIQETDIDELRESIYLIIDDFISDNIEEYRHKDFTTRLFEYSYHILDILYNDIAYMELNLSELIDEGIYSYFEFYGIKRSETTKITPENKRSYTQVLENIKKKDTHEQGTMEWFHFRWNHITASSAWKALENEAAKNQIIYNKCQPINPAKYSRVNITSAMHHGHKFEPLSVLIYEELYNTQIGDYGCIENDNHPYLAASPDGINIKLDNPRYGRALEIKNPTTREICGVPKKDYWVQMQLQMECLDLDECDFLETAFKEYATEDEFLADGDFNSTKDGKRKGIILCFNNGSKPMYEYTPLAINTYAEYEVWKDGIIDKNPGLSWIEDTFWYLKTISCVLVRRNKLWFASVNHKFKELWDIILKERVEGFEHRKPKKRQKKIMPSSNVETITFKIDTETLKSFALSI